MFLEGDTLYNGKSQEGNIFGKILQGDPKLVVWLQFYCVTGVSEPEFQARSN